MLARRFVKRWGPGGTRVQGVEVEEQIFSALRNAKDSYGKYNFSKVCQSTADVFHIFKIKIIKL